MRLMRSSEPAPQMMRSGSSPKACPMACRSAVEAPRPRRRGPRPTRPHARAPTRSPCPPQGPIYLNVALEHMLHDWTPPAAAREVPPAPTVQPLQEDVEKVAELVRNSKSPVIVTE